MKKTIILLIAISISTFAIGQEEKTEQIKEVGLTFRNLDNFGFSYKVGTEQSLWRFNLLSISGGIDNDDEYDSDHERDSKRFGFGFKVGKEYRKPISNKMDFRYGADLSFGYSYRKSNLDSKSGTSYESEQKNNNYTPGMNMVLGVNYKISEQFVFGAEIMPYLNYSFSKEKRKVDNAETSTKSNNLSYGISSSSVLLSLAYRF